MCLLVVVVAGRLDWPGCDALLGPATTMTRGRSPRWGEKAAGGRGHEEAAEGSAASPVAAPRGPRLLVAVPLDGARRVPALPLLRHGGRRPPAAAPAPTPARPTRFSAAQGSEVEVSGGALHGHRGAPSAAGRRSREGWRVCVWVAGDCAGAVVGRGSSKPSGQPSPPPPPSLRSRSQPAPPPRPPCSDGPRDRGAATTTPGPRRPCGGPRAACPPARPALPPGGGVGSGGGGAWHAGPSLPRGGGPGARGRGGAGGRWGWGPPRRGGERPPCPALPAPPPARGP